jgi:hypothetical protein
MFYLITIYNRTYIVKKIEYIKVIVYPLQKIYKIISFITSVSSFDQMHVFEEYERNLFCQYGILTHGDLTDGYLIEKENIEISNKFFISCHGSRINNSSHARIRVPENFIIYFQAENGGICELDDNVDKIPKICYNDSELLLWFKNVSYGLYTDKDTKPEFWNRRWVNKYVHGSIINDCLLSGDKDTEVISSKVVFCSSVIGGQILWEFLPGKEILLSKLLIQILNYINFESILQPYNIFCSFCLKNDNRYHENITQEQNEINEIYPQIYTFEESTNPVDY